MVENNITVVPIRLTQQQLKNLEPYCKMFAVEPDEIVRAILFYVTSCLLEHDPYEGSDLLGESLFYWRS